MKCVRRVDRFSNRVIRVPNEVATELVESGQWHLTSKGAWKSAGRERPDRMTICEFRKNAQIHGHA